VAFAFFTTLAGRVGAARGSVTVYFIPVVAIVLGVLLGGESVALIALAGTALVLVGAYLTSRKEADPVALSSGMTEEGCHVDEVRQHDDRRR
jgi:drug/metabolite transporter (DMT)-like permease